MHSLTVRSCNGGGRKGRGGGGFVGWVGEGGGRRAKGDKKHDARGQMDEPGERGRWGWYGTVHLGSGADAAAATWEWKVGGGEGGGERWSTVSTPWRSNP